MTGGHANDQAPSRDDPIRSSAEELHDAAHAPISIPDLRDVLNGKVITPDDASHPTEIPHGGSGAAATHRHASNYTENRCTAEVGTGKRRRPVNPIAGHTFGQLPGRQR